jgi:amidase
MGAVFYCKTSVPHSLMAGETVNNIIGYTYNPKNRHLSAGGSSGGEGALIGLRGSCVGLGSDIGGSVRVPSAFNGVFGIRPSHGRLPYQGVPISMDGQESIPCVVGPMASTIRSLKMIFQRILEGNPWVEDPMTLNLPWRYEHEHFVTNRCHPANPAGKLAIAIFESDGVVTPDPPVRRSLSILAEAIQRAGHEVRRIDVD